MLTTLPSDDPAQPTSCRCWNCCFNFWLFEPLETPPYYVRFPCIWDSGKEVPTSVTDIVSTIVINFGLTDSQEFWSNFNSAAHQIEYFKQMGFQMIKLNKLGFFCATCECIPARCKCEVAAPPEAGFPDFQLPRKCPCCQSYETCQCMYRFIDYGPGEYHPCEWTPVTKRIHLKLLAAEAILWSMLTLSVQEAMLTPPKPQYTPCIETYGEECYWKVAYDSELRSRDIPFRCAYEGLNALHNTGLELHPIAT